MVLRALGDRFVLVNPADPTRGARYAPFNYDVVPSRSKHGQHPVTPQYLEGRAVRKRLKQGHALALFFNLEAAAGGRRARESAVPYFEQFASELAAAGRGDDATLVRVYQRDSAPRVIGSIFQQQNPPVPSPFAEWKRRILESGGDVVARRMLDLYAEWLYRRSSYVVSTEEAAPPQRRTAAAPAGSSVDPCANANARRNQVIASAASELTLTQTSLDRWLFERQFELRSELPPPLSLRAAIEAIEAASRAVMYGPVLQTDRNYLEFIRGQQRGDRVLIAPLASWFVLEELPSIRRSFVQNYFTHIEPEPAAAAAAAPRHRGRRIPNTLGPQLRALERLYYRRILHSLGVEVRARFGAFSVFLETRGQDTEDILRTPAPRALGDWYTAAEGSDEQGRRQLAELGRTRNTVSFSTAYANGISAPLFVEFGRARGTRAF